MYSEVPRCTQINRKAIRDGSKSFRIHIMDLVSCRLRPNIPVLAFCGPETKVHRSSEVPECTDLNEKATKDIESTCKMDHNHLRAISRTFVLLTVILAYFLRLNFVYR